MWCPSKTLWIMFVKSLLRREKCHKWLQRKGDLEDIMPFILIPSKMYSLSSFLGCHVHSTLLHTKLSKVVFFCPWGAKLYFVDMPKGENVCYHNSNIPSHFMILFLFSFKRLTCDFTLPSSESVSTNELLWILLTWRYWQNPLFGQQRKCYLKGPPGRTPR